MADSAPVISRRFVRREPWRCDSLLVLRYVPMRGSPQSIPVHAELPRTPMGGLSHSGSLPFHLASEHQTGHCYQATARKALYPEWTKLPRRISFCRRALRAQTVSACDTVVPIIVEGH
jgi:hypothetical protein